MFASKTRTTGACRAQAGTGAAASSSGAANASWAATMTAAAAASHQRRAIQRPGGHHPGRQVDDQGEGVEHDQRLGRVRGYQPQQRDEPEHRHDQPADDEKAGPHDSRSAAATARGRSLPPRWCQVPSA